MTYAIFMYQKYILLFFSLLLQHLQHLVSLAVLLHQPLCPPQAVHFQINSCEESERQVVLWGLPQLTFAPIDIPTQRDIISLTAFAGRVLVGFKGFNIPWAVAAVAAGGLPRTALDANFP